LQFFFKRYEKKYLLTSTQADALQDALKNRMSGDPYGTYWVQNIYFDTLNWDVIRTSMERPLYKEKLRLRCYGIPDDGGNIFLELKKKYSGVVYKRRIALPVPTIAFGNTRETMLNVLSGDDAQITKELRFYLQSNDVTDKMYIAFHRTAFADIHDPGLRITFDTDIHYRVDKLDFANPGLGIRVLPPDTVLMETKTQANLPLWLARLFSQNNVYMSSFSKYGTCFTHFSTKEMCLNA